MEVVSTYCRERYTMEMKINMVTATVLSLLLLPAVDGQAARHSYLSSVTDKIESAESDQFSADDISAGITVVDYRQPHYREVSSEKAADLIRKSDPLILDVRTPAEYRQGHLNNSILIPVQELQSRLRELTPYKNKAILIYCATGNRSTVASKILIDNDFKQIINLRYGIYEWYMKKYPIVR